MALGIVKKIRYARSLLQKMFYRLFNRNVYFEGVAYLANGSNVKVTDGASVYFGADVSVSRGASIVAQMGEIHFGNNVFVGPWSSVVAKSEIKIGNDVLIAERVTIRDQDHNIGIRHNALIAKAGFSVSPVSIGDGVWVGAGAVILKGVNVGNGAVIGANAVVSRNVEPNAIVGGVPARVIGYRTANRGDAG